MKGQTSLDLNKIEIPLLNNVNAILKATDAWSIYRYEVAKACVISRVTLVEWQRKGSALDSERLIKLNTGLRTLIKQKKKALNNAF